MSIDRYANKIIMFYFFLILVSGCLVESPSSENEDGFREIHVELENFKITPSIITVDQGEKVRFRIVTVKGKHNFFIVGYNLRTEIREGQNTQFIEFTAEKKGEFDFWCEVEGHKAKGMQGIMIVQ